jgi:hypothetical protein
VFLERLALAAERQAEGIVRIATALEAIAGAPELLNSLAAAGSVIEGKQGPDRGDGKTPAPTSMQAEIEVMPLSEAARLLGVSLRKACKMRRAGELQGPAGKPYRAYRRSVEELLRTPRIPPQTSSVQPGPASQPEQRNVATTQAGQQRHRRKRSPRGFEFFHLP